MPTIVPDQQSLAAALSLEIKILTTRSAIGDHADPSKIIYIACAGRKSGAWKVLLIRSQHGLDVDKIVEQIRKKWPLAVSLTWETPSKEIARRLVESIGSEFDKAVKNPDNCEWDDRFCDVEDPSIKRRQLERMRAVPHKAKEQEQEEQGDTDDLIEEAA